MSMKKQVPATLKLAVAQPTVLLENSRTAAPPSLRKLVDRSHHRPPPKLMDRSRPRLRCEARRADPPRRADKAAPRKIAALQTVILNERHSRE